MNRDLNEEKGSANLAEPFVHLPTICRRVGENQHPFQKGQNFLPSEQYSIIKEIQESRIGHRPSKHEEKAPESVAFSKGNQFDNLIHLNLEFSNLL